MDIEALHGDRSLSAALAVAVYSTVNYVQNRK